jgi:hypothetical protein
MLIKTGKTYAALIWTVERAAKVIKIYKNGLGELTVEYVMIDENNAKNFSDARTMSAELFKECIENYKRDKAEKEVVEVFEVIEV